MGTDVVVEVVGVVLLVIVGVVVAAVVVFEAVVDFS